MSKNSVIVPNDLIKKNCYLGNIELKTLLTILSMSSISREGERLKTLNVDKKNFISNYWGSHKFINSPKEAKKQIFNLFKKSWWSEEFSEITALFSYISWNNRKSFFTVTFSEPFYKCLKINIGDTNKWKDFSIINSNYIKNDKGTHVIKLVFKLFSWTKDKGEFQRFISFEEMKEILGISQNSYLSRGKFSPSLFNNLVLKPSFKKIEKFGEFSNINVEIDNKKRVFLIKWNKKTKEKSFKDEYNYFFIQ